MTRLSITWVGDEQLVAYLKSAGKKIEFNIKSGLTDIADLLHDEVRKKFGTYQNGWPKLKRESVIAKYRRRQLNGFKRPKLNKGTLLSIGPDDPLILFERLKDSIEKEVNSNQAIVYSDNPYSAVHEYGYAPKNIPSRSYMRLTLKEEESKVIRIIDDKVRRSL